MLVAEVVSDGIDGVDTGDVDDGVLDNFAALHIDAANLLQGTSGCAVVSNKLSHDSELRRSIDNHALAAERGAVLAGSSISVVS